jgi:hypothetical protein
MLHLEAKSVSSLILFLNSGASGGEVTPHNNVNDNLELGKARLLNCSEPVSFSSSLVRCPPAPQPRAKHKLSLQFRFQPGMAITCRHDNSYAGQVFSIPLVTAQAY